MGAKLPLYETQEKCLWEYAHDGGKLSAYEPKMPDKKYLVKTDPEDDEEEKKKEESSDDEPGSMVA